MRNFVMYLISILTLSFLMLGVIAYFSTATGSEPRINKFYHQNVDEWKVMGYASDTEEIVCSASKGDENVSFSYNILWTKGDDLITRPALVTLSFRNKDWVLRKGHANMGSMTVKEKSGQVHGFDIEYAADKYAIVEINSPTMFQKLLDQTESISFTPGVGFEAISIKVDSNMMQVFGPMRECFYAANNLEYFK